MKNLYLALCLFAASSAYSQITFTQIPMDSELVARNLNTNLGTFNIQGLVDSVNAPYDSVCLKIFRGSVIVDSIYQDLYYFADSAPFNFSFQIPAELQEYKVALYGIKNRLETLDTTINALLAGDVYVIDG
ncbi:MAG TPA: hypothetical protein VK808_05285, partial [Bacteroidia bacterium]|nr:hypothetical protein [Bacteroidia bacterium]